MSEHQSLYKESSEKSPEKVTFQQLETLFPINCPLASLKFIQADIEKPHLSTRPSFSLWIFQLTPYNKIKSS